jgi:hypothetical protein
LINALRSKTMKRAEFTWTSDLGWVGLPEADFAPDLVLYFGSRFVLADHHVFDALKARFPKAIVLGASGGGQIHRSGIIDDGVTGLALKFEHSTIKLVTSVMNDSGGSHAAGRILGMGLQAEDLAGVFVLTEGLNINGDQLIGGMSSHLSPDVVICGGMAADDGRFERTILCADAPPMRGVAAAIGFYGKSIRLGFGHGGGWQAIGEEMDVSLSRDNVLYDLNGNSALGIYETQLGTAAAQLPLSGLKFPLSIRDPERKLAPLVRTLLAIDRDVGTMTFAGNVPENWKVRLMNASSEDLISAAANDAASPSIAGIPCDAASASILISCIGRRLVLGDDSKLEVDAVCEKLGSGSAVTGFYSYGEFCTPEAGNQAQLFNQSMIVFSISEEAP